MPINFFSFNYERAGIYDNNNNNNNDDDDDDDDDDDNESKM